MDALYPAIAMIAIPSKAIAIRAQVVTA